MVGSPFLEFSCLLVLTQRTQAVGEVVGRGQGVGVVRAENPLPIEQDTLEE